VAQPDESLLVGLSVGDEQAFAALYDREAARLYRAALAMLTTVASPTMRNARRAISRSS
jgi:hypothetical protein